MSRGGEPLATGVSISDFQRQGDELSFTALAERLPDPDAPALETQPPPAALSPVGTLAIKDLPPGRYELLEGNEVVHQATDQQWAAGQPLTRRAGWGAVEMIRQLTMAKNELFFHRYRPQNETYLFLFRKHEQGNNAVEVPRFDPLVRAKEQEIDALRQPAQASYVLRPIKP